MVFIQNTQTGAQSRPIKAVAVYCIGIYMYILYTCILYTCIHLYIYILYTNNNYNTHICYTPMFNELNK